MSDTSTPANRVAFVTGVEGGVPRVAVAVAPTLSNCMIVLPDTSAALLSLPSGATFAQGAAQLQARIAAGLAPL